MNKSSKSLLLSSDLIKLQIKDYLLNKDTNYAYMITGEWGIGKTYLLKNTLIPEIMETSLSEGSSSKYRPIYVSLSGIKDLERLKELMFSRLNIQTDIPRTLMDKEIELLKNVMSEQDLTPLISIPSNIVFCFDDLERINPLFLEEALGFINTYIEHNHTKAIFLCNDTRLQDGMQKRYRLIIEKYIRFSIEYKPDFEEILKSNKILSTNEKEQIVSVFRRGLCYNIRTLEYVLSSVEKVCESFNSIIDSLKVDSNYISLLQKSLIHYTVFFAIELKRGGLSYESIKKVQMPNRVLSIAERGLNVDFSDNIERAEEENGNEEEELKKINIRYFDDNFEPFEPFESIAEYLRTGYLNEEQLENEIALISNSLKRREGTEEERVRIKILNIFDFSDEKYLDEISQILTAVDKGEFTLGTYLQIYSQLLVLESYGIKGIIVDESMTTRFKDAMKKGTELSKIEYDSALMDKYSSLWSSSKGKFEQSAKYRTLLTFADKLNNEIIEREKQSIPTTEILLFINNDKIGDLYAIMVDQRWKFILDEKTADHSFEALKKATAVQVNNFRSCLKDRYALRDGQTPASSEYPFIKKMIELIEKYERQVGDNKTISYIPFVLMKNNLKECINYFGLNKA